MNYKMTLKGLEENIRAKLDDVDSLSEFLLDNANCVKKDEENLILIYDCEDKEISINVPCDYSRIIGVLLELDEIKTNYKNILNQNGERLDLAKKQDCMYIDRLYRENEREINSFVIAEDGEDILKQVQDRHKDKELDMALIRVKNIVDEANKILQESLEEGVSKELAEVKYQLIMCKLELIKEILSNAINKKIA